MFNFQAGGWWWVWLCVAVPAVVGVIVLYRYERRLVAARIGNTLLALRLSAVSVLFLALLQPVVTLTQESDQPAVIVVAVDVSDSMRSSDPQATQAEKLRWARALQTIGNEANAARLERWQDALDQNSEPEWVTPAETDSQEASQILAQRRRKNLSELLEKIGRLPRLEIAQRLLSSTTTPLLEELRQVGDVRLVLFAGESKDVDPELLNSLENLESELNGSVTDFQAMLSLAVRANEEQPVAGIVLFSDGRETASHDSDGALQLLKSTQTPVFPVMMGSSHKPADITIADLDYPSSVFLGDTPRISVTLGTTGFAGREIEVVLKPSTGEPISKTVTATEQTVEVPFDWRAERAGRHAMTITASALPGEMREENNSASFALTVIDDTVRVLMLEEEARWEFRFIDNAFRRDDRVEVQPVIFEQPYLNVLDESFFARSFDWPIDPADWEKSPLAEIDMVIVGDVSPQFLTPAVWETLERFVDEGRGTLVLCSGRNYMPVENLPEAWERLLPVSDLEEIKIVEQALKLSPLERGFHLKLTGDGQREPMLQFATSIAENRIVWEEFPGHVWGLAGKAKPGASVLATLIPPATEDADLMNDRAVIARQTYGAGQVLWLGIDSTWRWRYRAGDRYHHRFWGQVARWAAQRRSSGGTDAVRFGPERNDIQQGEPAVFRARFSPVFLERTEQLKTAAEIFAADDVGQTRLIRRIPLEPNASRSSVFEGRTADLPAGDYLARLVVEHADFAGAEITAPLYVSQPASREFADLSADVDFLEQIATSGGGRVIAADQLEELPALLNSRSASAADVTEISLWNHPLLLLLFCALVGAEWAVRKLNGLP